MSEIAQGLRRRGEKAKRAIRKPYRRLARITGRLVRQAERATEQASRQLRTMRGRRRVRVDRLATLIGTTAKHGRQVIRQTRARVLGAETRTPGKIVSVFEPWAQIIRKGKLDRPTEFGAVVKVQESEAGIVTDIAVDDARADALLLVPSVELHQSLFGHVPRTVAPIAASSLAEVNVASTNWVSGTPYCPSQVTGPETALPMKDSAGSSAAERGVLVARPAYLG
jgi:hypothetical protein